MPIGILFVCTANKCRSPMAEGVFRSMARRAGLASAFSVDSAGTFDGYVGKPPAPPAIKATALRGYGIAGLRARQVVAADIARFDYVPAMDRSHFADLRWMAPRVLFERLRLFTDFDPSSTAVDVADPYGGDDARLLRGVSANQFNELRRRRQSPEMWGTQGDTSGGVSRPEPRSGRLQARRCRPKSLARAYCSEKA